MAISSDAIDYQLFPLDGSYVFAVEIDRNSHPEPSFRE
jgi:hypothetical protein